MIRASSRGPWWSSRQWPPSGSRTWRCGEDSFGEGLTGITGGRKGTELVTGPFIQRLLRKDPLSKEEVESIVAHLALPDTSDPERAGILVAWEAHPSSEEELASLAVALRSRAVPFQPPGIARAVELSVMRGGHGYCFNVSTVSAFVVAASGVPVVQLGDRRPRGPAGSSDLLEALGLPVTRSREFSIESFDAHQVAFLHVPLYQPVARAVT